MSEQRISSSVIDVEHRAKVCLDPDRFSAVVVLQHVFVELFGGPRPCPGATLGAREWGWAGLGPRARALRHAWRGTVRGEVVLNLKCTSLYRKSCWA